MHALVLAPEQGELVGELVREIRRSILLYDMAMSIAIYGSHRAQKGPTAYGLLECRGT